MKTPTRTNWKGDEFSGTPAAFAKPLGVQLLVENISNDLSTPEGLLELLHAGRFTDIGCASISATRICCRA